MKEQVAVGDTLSIDLTHDRFRHLGRKWLVGLVVIKAGVPTAFHEWSSSQQDSPCSSFLVGVEGVFTSLEKLKASGCLSSIHRVFDHELLKHPSLTKIGRRSLTVREARVAELVSKSLRKPVFNHDPINQSLNTNASLGYPTPDIVEDLVFEYGTPAFDHHYDCDFEFATHCLQCGLIHSKTLAKCHCCGKVRLGFELISDYIMDSCQPISEDTKYVPSTLFSQAISNVELTDVQGSDGKWYDPFTFIELYMNENNLI